MSRTIKCRFPIKRRDPSTVGETVVAPLRPVQEPSSPRTTRVGRQLALAHHVERLIEAGGLRDYADAARALGLTRARLTQVMNLLLLAPGIQERVLVGDEPVPARVLRAMCGVAGWGQQLALRS